MSRLDIEAPARGIPIVFVNDFNNDLSPIECEIRIRNAYEDHGVLFEPPHMVRDVDGFDITDGAFHLRQSARNRTGRATVLTAVVDPGVGTNRRAVVVETVQGHTYIGPDNGVLSPALSEEQITNAYAFRHEVFESSSVTFHGRDVFAPTAARISAGERPSEMKDLLLPINPDGLTVFEFTPETVVHVDGYGGKPGTQNYGGNVKFELRGIPVNDWGDKATSAQLTLPRRSRGLPRRSITVPVKRTFGEAKPGEFLIYEGSSDSGVELAVNGGKGRKSAAGRLRLHTGDRVGFDWRIPGKNGTR